MRFLIGSILVALLFNFATPQSLVLVGGGLSDGNAVIWDRVVELAVRIHHFIFLYLILISLVYFYRVVVELPGSVSLRQRLMIL